MVTLFLKVLLLFTVLGSIVGIWITNGFGFAIIVAILWLALIALAYAALGG